MHLLESFFVTPLSNIKENTDQLDLIDDSMVFKVVTIYQAARPVYDEQGQPMTDDQGQAMQTISLAFGAIPHLDNIRFASPSLEQFFPDEVAVIGYSDKLDEIEERLSELEESVFDDNDDDESSDDESEENKTN